MLFILAVAAVHLVVISAALFGAWKIWQRFPHDLRSFDLGLALLASVILLAVMIALPHWGFGRIE
jgi:glutamine cyclotransferase